jgi:uridylate kinase
MKNNYSETIILKLGGSLIVPNGGLNIPYITQFYKFIRRQVRDNNKRFFIFPGGGKLSRHYRDAGKEITGQKLTGDDLDWLGIHVTRLNAHLFRTIFRDLAHPKIIDNYDFIEKPKTPIIIASGSKPGWSTDYNAVVLANDYNIKKIIKLSNTDYVYDKDPNKDPSAKKFDKISWKKFREIVGDRWIPGQSTPFDPIASKAAEETEMAVYYLHGHDLENTKKAIEGKAFKGTIIE